MVDNRAKSEMVIELDTQEALNKISEIRVDLQVPERHIIQRERYPDHQSAQRERYPDHQSIQRERYPDHQSAQNAQREQYSYKRQETIPPHPAASYAQPVIKKQPVEIRDGRVMRKATVKVNGVEAHVVSTTFR